MKATRTRAVLRSSVIGNIHDPHLSSEALAFRLPEISIDVDVTVSKRGKPDRFVLQAACDKYGRVGLAEIDDADIIRFIESGYEAIDGFRGILADASKAIQAYTFSESNKIKSVVEATDFSKRHNQVVEASVTIEGTEARFYKIRRNYYVAMYGEVDNAWPPIFAEICAAEFDAAAKVSRNQDAAVFAKKLLSLGHQAIGREDYVSYEEKDDTDE